MPVYIRKNVSFTPPSIYNMQLEDDNDYLLDPDQMRDILPQPYRMINKILTGIIEDAWAILEGKENAILAEAQKVRAPRLEESVQVPIHSNATSLAESVDGKVIFVGLPNGLAAMDALSQFPLHKWEEDHAEITSIKTYMIAPEYHLISTVDDMGIARIFLFAFDHIFFIKALNENPPEGTSKILCQKCEASSGGDYLGVSFENTGNKEVWLEVQKIPLENWLKDLESIHSAINKQKDENEKSHTDLTAQGGEAETESQPKPTEDTKSDEVVAVSVESVIEKLGTKFGPPHIVLKVKAPAQKCPGPNPSSSIASAVSKVDQGDVLGTGNTHVLGAAHLESRDAMFKQRHEGLLEYLPEEEEENTVSVTFHFTNTSRMIPFGMEHNTPASKPVSVGLWWSGTQHICHYSLLKTGKAEEDSSVNLATNIEFKPDIVWPCSDTITCSTISPCGSHFAVGLANGNLALWDYQMGLPKAVLTVCGNGGVKELRFLDPTLFPCNLPEYPPYPVASATFVLAEYCDGTQALFDTCDGSQQIPRVIASVPEYDDDVQTLVKVIPDLPELMLFVKKNGSMYIKDVGTGASLCQVCLPPTHTIQTPWSPIYALGAGSHVLYLKGEGKDVSEDGEVSDISCLFKFSLRDYPILEEYWARPREKSELIVYTTCQQRLDSLMKERLQQQAMRKPRMQLHWGQLRGELDIIQNAREVPVDTLRLSAPSSLQSIPETIKFRPSMAKVI